MYNRWKSIETLQKNVLKEIETIFFEILKTIEKGFLRRISDGVEIFVRVNYAFRSALGSQIS